ncbi:hypothetical protein OG413_45940 [Streptomyces sp. NBC_01433]|uniref:hypothetical protein n=1 Tax=Streptomyces sp. NBC_01433 TaxID=2903864 RepID=UPI002253074A|nr:hypothetical protein [Streptomyces sp. NBC_01433]MCX4682475.1 hypothetical protein [Streptomyces sp. NBC_01433]MCX4682528.1 hypothetical protein [Streptomyces sp. NBC_01433]
MSDPHNIVYGPVGRTTAAVQATLEGGNAFYDQFDPTIAALHTALDQLVYSHSGEDAPEASWVLRLDRAEPPADEVDGAWATPGPATVTVAVGQGATHIDVTHPPEDDEPPLTVPLSTEVTEQLVFVVLALVENHYRAQLSAEEDCLHCGGNGLARPLWEPTS